MKVKIEDVEIRGVEQRESKKEGAGPYWIVRFEDSTGLPCEVLDRDPDRAAYYKRGALGDFYCDLRMGRDWARLNVIDFKLKATDK